mgnify:CR=1 FL=1
MKIKIVHADILTPGEFLANQEIDIKDGKIISINPSNNDLRCMSHNERVINARDLLVTPGLIDIHIHGCMGSDTMDATPEALETMSIFLVQHGVTSFHATTVSNPQENINLALDNILHCEDMLSGANLLGAHIEGPYINMKYKGAQNPKFLRSPQPEEYMTWIEKGIVKLLTFAPELDGSDDLIHFCVENEVELAIGHSNATLDQVLHAANLGVKQATHLFNGMSGLHHREPGTVGGILYDPRIYAQVIADGIHLHPAIVELTIAVKGIDCVILITDAMRATGLPDGEYELGGQAVRVADGAARIANGSLAGSTLTLDQAIRNTIEFTKLDFQSVLKMATSTPATAMGISDRKGFIRVGNDADLTFFDSTYHVIATMVGGEFKFQIQNPIGE